jgi:anti-sigma regulatory factor (Ser/Thr protein kinase)
VIARRRFEPTEESVGEGRRFVGETISDLPAELQDAVSLMVSELATNALVHASSGFDISVDRSEAAVVISITDRGAGTPAVQSPASSEPHGRGLRIVEALADSWGITPSSPKAGKTVWFQMSLHRASIDRLQGAAFVDPEDEQAEGSTARTSHPASSLSASELHRSDQPSAYHRSIRRRLGALPRLPARRRVLSQATV